jgi:opacity protein-like surface antigen
MRTARVAVWRSITVAFAIAGTSFVPWASVKAELYAGGMAGAVLPQSLENVRDGKGAKYSDLAMKPAVAVGAKLGYFFPRATWLGVQTEAFLGFPLYKQQVVSGTGPSCPCRLTTEAAGNMTVATWALNAIVRYPGKQLQPYAGVGVGLFFARLPDSDWDQAVPGLNALAGVRYFIGDRIALFIEYKYNRARFNFDRGAVDRNTGQFTSLTVDYSASLLVIGNSFHW